MVLRPLEAATAAASLYQTESGIRYLTDADCVYVDFEKYTVVEMEQVQDHLRKVRREVDINLRFG